MRSYIGWVGLAVHLLPSSQNVHAQGGFSAIYAAEGFQEANVVRQLPDGTYILGGRGSSNSGSGAFLMKVDPIGESVWTVNYPDTFLSFCADLELIGEEGFVLCGASHGSGSQDSLVVARVDQLGNVQWFLRYSASSTGAFGHSIASSPDGGFIACGSTGNPLTGDLLVVRLDSLGGAVWERTIDLGGADQATSVALLEDNGSVLSGTSDRDSPGYSDIALVRLDALGDTLWTRLFPGIDVERGTSVCRTIDGGFAIVGYDNSTWASMIIIKTDQYGNLQWQVNVPGQSDTKAYDIIPTPQGDLMIAGQIGDSTYYRNLCLVKISVGGEVQWLHTFPVEFQSCARSVSICGDGGFVLAGYKYGGEPTIDDVYMVRTGPDGYVGITSPDPERREVRLFPNPASQMTWVYVSEFLPSGSVLKVYASDGRLVHSMEPKTARHIPLDCSRLTTGRYMLVIGHDGVVVARSVFIVQQ